MIILTEPISLSANQKENHQKIASIHLTAYRGGRLLLAKVKDGVNFPNGIIMEISVCAPCDTDSAAWAEASLFARSTEKEDSFIEVALTECEPELSGRWELEYKGNVYVVDVVGAS